MKDSSAIDFQKAVALYHERCDKEGAIPMQPANTSQQCPNGTWWLENCNGRLARVFANGHVELG